MILETLLRRKRGRREKRKIRNAKAPHSFVMCPNPHSFTKHILQILLLSSVLKPSPTCNMPTPIHSLPFPQLGLCPFHLAPMPTPFLHIKLAFFSSSFFSLYPFKKQGGWRRRRDKRARAAPLPLGARRVVLMNGIAITGGVLCWSPSLSSTSRPVLMLHNGAPRDSFGQ